MVLFAMPSRSGQGSRLGVTASRKVGGAVTRSRCRRRLRELYRLFYSEQEVALDLVVNARRGCASASWHELELEFKKALEVLSHRLAARLRTGIKGEAKP